MTDTSPLAPARTSDPIADIRPGDQAYVSDWVTVTQEMIDDFGRCTLDPDPMHVDPEWAANGPFGGTIAFGFLTISLLTHMMHSAIKTSPGREPASAGYFLNYGFDRLRLVTPVPVGSRVRGVFKLASREPDEKGRLVAAFDALIEIEGEARPALAARWLSIWVPPAAA